MSESENRNATSHRAESHMSSLVAFSLDDRCFAVRLSSVERVVRAVEITPLPKAPETVLGIIDVQGRIIPVIDIRGRFGLPEREPDVNDQLIIAKTLKRTIALPVDEVGGVVGKSGLEMVPTGSVFQGIGYIEGVVKLEDGLILIVDLDALFSLNGEDSPEKNIAAREGAPYGIGAQECGGGGQG